MIIFKDFLLQTTDVLSSRPKEMIVEIQLPKLDSAANLDLDVQVLIYDLDKCLLHYIT